MGSFISLLNDTDDEWIVKITLPRPMKRSSIEQREEEKEEGKEEEEEEEEETIIKALMKDKTNEYVCLKPGERKRHGKVSCSLVMQAHCLRERVDPPFLITEEIVMRPIFSGATNDSVNEYPIATWLKTSPPEEIQRQLLSDQHKVFGIELEEAAAKNKENKNIPRPLFDSFRYIESVEVAGDPVISEEGLYRVPGSVQVFERYRLYYDYGRPVDLSQEKNVENVTIIVIRYLKALPKSILHPFEKEFELCQRNCGIDSSKLAASLPGLLRQLSVPRFETLKRLIQHLKQVSNHSEKNKMTPANIERTLAICLGANLGWLIGALLSHSDFFEK